MKLTLRLTVLLALLLSTCPAPAEEALPPIPPIKRVLPPEGIEIPAKVRQRLEARLAETKKRLDEEFDDYREPPDVEIFTKAVELALLHREFYAPKDFEKADWALDQANSRLDVLNKQRFDSPRKGQQAAPWTRTTGLVVRGYRSPIDRSVQPYGLVIPEGHNFDEPCPKYVWLHGRGDKNTDLHFLYERATKVGQIAPPGVIVVHPFGRHCVGFKHAGERDVIDLVDEIDFQYETDVSSSPVLMGFSMGGAGAWHIGAHYPMSWSVVSPGAGFAETARYQNLTPDKYPSWYEEKLWGQYDVPNYVRNLFNLDVIAYSGELDKQIQAARVMEEAYRAEGQTLPHLIGPGVEHRYEPKTLEKLLSEIAQRSQEPMPPLEPEQCALQTRTLRYNWQHWITATELAEHWVDSRVDGEKTGEHSVRIKTKNVVRLELQPFDDMRKARIEIDGDVLEVRSARATPREIIPGNKDALRSIAYLVRKNGKWQEDEEIEPSQLRKSHGRQGPIDDAFMDEFLVVIPTGKSRNPRFQRWCDFELQHFLDRWRALMRAEAPTIKDEDFAAYHANVRSLIFWGDPDSNSALRRVMSSLPVRFENGNWTLGTTTYEGARFVPALIYPSAEENARYIVLNSGLTFREGHDRTNSLQNPKLPDWAIIDITRPPDAFAPGRIHDAGFFDERWQLKNQPKAP